MKKEFITALFGAIAGTVFGWLGAGALSLWKAPTLKDFERLEKKVDAQTQRIEQRTFDMAFALGQQDERSKSKSIK